MNITRYKIRKANDISGIWKYFIVLYGVQISSAPIRHDCIKNFIKEILMTDSYKMIRLTFLFCAVLLTACEKENKDYPKTYYFDSFETGEVRIFTNNGEINDVQLSAGFINRYGDYFYGEDAFRLDDFDFKGEITLGANNQSVIRSSDSVMTYGFQLKNGVIYFESSDTSYSFSDLMNMKDERLKFGPITQTSISEGLLSGFPPRQTIWYGYLPCVYAIDEEDEIKFPFVSFLEKNCYVENTEGLTGNCNNINAFSTVNNMFNENYVKRIVNNYQISPGYENRDTIVIQENYVVFRKQ